ncbi:MAG: O-antigen ligase family protein [Lachnospiraceae bacterium]
MKKITIYRFIAFIIGFLCCSNIFYLFKVGNTYIQIVFVLTSLVCVIYLFRRSKEFFQAIRNMNLFFRIYFILALLSIINVILFMGFGYLETYIKGIISLTLTASLYLAVLFLKDYKKQLINGVYIGFISNMVYTIIQFIAYNHGITLSLYQLFPQKVFQVSTFWLSNSFSNFLGFNIYYFRPLGFFLETSYFVAFVISVILLVFNRGKRNWFDPILMIIVLFSLVLTASGNLVILMVIIFLYVVFVILKKRKVKYIINSKTFFYHFFLVIILLLTVLLNLSKFTSFLENNNIVQNLTKSIETSDLTNEDNAERFYNMLASIELIPENPIGSGFNMSVSLLKNNAPDLRVFTTFNYLLTTMLDLGFVGLIVYLIFIYQITVKVLFKAKSKYEIAVSIGAFGAFLCQIANGLGFYPFTVLIFALSNLIIVERREDNHKNINSDIC